MTRLHCSHPGYPSPACVSSKSMSHGGSQENFYLKDSSYMLSSTVSGISLNGIDLWGLNMYDRMFEHAQYVKTYVYPQCVKDMNVQCVRNIGVFIQHIQSRLHDEIYPVEWFGTCKVLPKYIWCSCTDILSPRTEVSRCIVPACWTELGPHPFRKSSTNLSISPDRIGSK